VSAGRICSVTSPPPPPDQHLGVRVDVPHALRRADATYRVSAGSCLQTGWVAAGRKGLECPHGVLSERVVTVATRMRLSLFACAIEQYQHAEFNPF
jgi:hypothetical protein